MILYSTVLSMLNILDYISHKSKTNNPSNQFKQTFDDFIVLFDRI